MRSLFAVAVVSLLVCEAAAARLKYRPSPNKTQSVSSRARIRAARKAAPPPVVVGGGPVKGGAVNLPHARGRRSAFAFENAAPPPPEKAAAPKKSIQQEFLERVRAAHVRNAAVKAVKPGRVKEFDPNREDDTEIIVIEGGGSSGALPPSGVHNRDQGGKPAAKKELGKKK